MIHAEMIHETHETKPKTSHRSITAGLSHASQQLGTPKSLADPHDVKPTLVDSEPRLRLLFALLNLGCSVKLLIHH